MVIPILIHLIHKAVIAILVNLVNLVHLVNAVIAILVNLVHSAIAILVHLANWNLAIFTDFTMLKTRKCFTETKIFIKISIISIIFKNLFQNVGEKGITLCKKKLLVECVKKIYLSVSKNF